jgi:hypothetical protein
LPLVGTIIDDKPVRFQDIPRDILLPEIALSMIDKYKRDGVHISDLTICPYTACRNKLTEYYLPLRTIITIANGKAIDSYAQHHPRPNALYQIALERELNGTMLSGTPDIIDLANKSIEDYKVPARKWSEISPGYILQLNAYRWMAEDVFFDEDGELIEFDKLILDVVNIPGKNTQQMCVPVWDLWETQVELADRLANFIELYNNKVLARCGDKKCVYCYAERIEVPIE